MKYCKFAVLYCALSCACFAKSGSTLMSWVEETSPSFLQIVNYEDLENWPRLDSILIKDQLSAETDSKNRDFALSILSAVLEYDKQSMSAGMNLEETVKRYSKLSIVCVNSGGYYNLVLADSLRRLIVSQTSYRVVSHPEEVEVFKNCQRDFPEPFFQNIKREEVGRELGKLLGLEVTSYTDGKFDLGGFYQVFMTDLFEIRSKIAKDPSISMASNLIINPMPAVLAHNICETELVLSVHLPGSIEYLKLGGDFDEINLADITKFRIIMNASSGKYTCPALGIRRLYAIHIHGLLKEFENLNDYGTDPISRRVR